MGVKAVENYTKATCTEDGSYDAVVYCIICGAELSRETTVISAGHSYHVRVWSWSADCSEAEAFCTCDACGDELTIEAEVTVETVSPTCVAEGSIIYTASVELEGVQDTDTQTVTLAATVVHTEGEAVVENYTESTCTVAGSYDTVVYCSVCGGEISRETTTLELSAHSYEAVVTDPTCTEDGYTTYTCTVCGSGYTDDIVSATGHSWDDGVVAKEATETEDGEILYTCTVCGATKTEVIPATGET